MEQITSRFATQPFRLPSGSAWREVPLLSWNSNDFYALFDRLTNSVVSRHEWTGARNAGTGANRLRYWYYVIEPRSRFITSEETDNAIYGSTTQPRPTLFFTAGLHGSERIAIYYLYLALRDILNSSAPLHRYMRNNVRIVILPVCNPHGVNQNTRRNERNVDLNRNFPMGWNSYNGEFKGTASLSEDGSRFVDFVLQQFTQTAAQRAGTFFADFHAFSYALNSTVASTQNRLLWFSGTNLRIRRGLLELSAWLIREFAAMYGTGTLISSTLSNRRNLVSVSQSFGNANSTPTSVNYVRSLGVSGAALCECIMFASRDGRVSARHPRESHEMSYLITYNFINEILGFTGEGISSFAATISDDLAETEIEVDEEE